LEKMFSLFPNATYELSCNSFNGRCYTNFGVYTKPEDFAPIAHRYYINAEELFDFSRPKIISTSSRTWNSSFVTIHFFLEGKYNFYYKNFQKIYSPIFTNIQLKSMKVESGLKDWKKRYFYLLNLMNKNSDKKLVENYRKDIKETNEKVGQWEKAIKRVGEIKL